MRRVMMCFVFVFSMIVLQAAQNHAVVVNEVKVSKNAKSGAGVLKIKAEKVSFKVKPGGFHPHNTAIKIKSIEVQGWQLGDGSWRKFKAKEDCTGKLKKGQQLRVGGEIKGKKLALHCRITSVKQ